MNRAALLSRLSTAIFSLAFLIAFVSSAGAQVSKGSISGTVVDPSEAAVAGADVKVTNSETSVTATTKSDGSGSFRINLLPVGTYKLEIKKEGFRTGSLSGIVVTVSADAALGAVKLELGATSETVEVSGSAPIIESTQAQVSSTFSGAEINNLPGVGENQGLDNLAVLLPGISGSRDLGFSNTNGGGGFTVNGIRGRNNDQEVDGQNNNDNSVGGPALFVANSEFVDQYQIITSNFGPEYGRNSGSVVNITTKHGTNNWHGVVKDTEGNSALNSLSNIQKAPTSTVGLGLTKVPRFNDNFWTAAIGGPVMKDKLFVFGGYDTEIVSSSNPFQTPLLTPTPAGLQAIAGCYTSALSQQSIAALTKYGPYGIAGGNPTPLDPQVVHLNNPVVANGTDPDSGQPSCDVQMGGVVRTLSNGFHQYDWTTRVDWNASPSDTVFFRYLWQRQRFFNNDSFVSGFAALGYPNNVPAQSQQLAIDWSHQLSSRMVNDLRLTFGRLNVVFGTNGIGNTVPGDGGVGDAVTNVIFSDTTLGGFGPATNSPQGRIVNTYQAQDNWTYAIGKHTLKGGVNFTYQRSPNVFLPNLNGQYRFGGNNIVDSDGTINSPGWTNFALNVPNRIRIALGQPDLDFREKDTFAYFGDDFRVAHNLTLNLGITYTYYGQPANLFHTDSTKQQTGPNPFWDPTLPLNVTTFPSIPAPTNSWGPGIGFAYSPDWAGHGKTVFRGGYRLAYDPPYYNIYLNISSAAPNVMLQTLGSSTAANNPLPAAPLGPAVRSALASQLTPGIFDPRQFNTTTITPNFGPDKTHQWSFGIQRELGAHAAVEAAYVGNHGLNLFQSINGNPDISSYPSNQLPASETPCANSFVPNNPIPGALDDTGRVSCTLPAVQRVRNNGGYSYYNGLQTEFRTNNIFNQLTLKTNYTFSKTLDNVSEIFSTFAGGGALSFSQNPLDNGRGEYGISGLDFRHTFTVSAYEALPFFRAQHGFMGKVFGGWGVAGSYIWQSGQPYTPQQFAFGTFTGGCCIDVPFANAFIGTFEALRPFWGNPSAPATSVGAFAADACNWFGDPVSCGLPANQLVDFATANATGVVNTVSQSQVRYILNGGEAQSVFGTPFGNVRRNSVTDSITNTTNIEISKETKLGERVNVRFWTSMVNAFNHPNYGYNLGAPDASTTFGGIDPFIDLDAGLAGTSGAGIGFGDPKVFDGGHRTIRFGLRIGF